MKRDVDSNSSKPFTYDDRGMQSLAWSHHQDHSHTDQQENYPEATGTMQPAAVEHDADAKYVTRTPSAPRKRDVPPTKLPFPSSLTVTTPTIPCHHSTTPPPYHALVRYAPSWKKCDQPTPRHPRPQQWPDQRETAKKTHASWSA